jgi:hypothetical protein
MKSKKKYTVAIIVLGIFPFLSFAATRTSSYVLPGENVFSQYIYISSDYEKLLSETKSHPAAIDQLKKPYSPILFFDDGPGEYCSNPFLHEAGPIVNIDKSQNQVRVFGAFYHKMKIDRTIEKTLAEVIIKNTFQRKHYYSKEFKVDISEGIVINNVSARIMIDVGAGGNNMNQTMIRSESKVNGFDTFAIIEDGDTLKLTPLNTDDIVAYSSGKTYALK